MTLRLPFSILLTTLLTLTACKSQSQPDSTADSLRLVQAPWQVDSLDGFCLKQCRFGDGELFGAAQHLFLIEIPQSSPRQLAFVCDSTPMEVSAFGERARALAAINGSYFDMDKGNPICYLRINGSPLGENVPMPTDSVRRKYYQYATLSLGSGRPHLSVPDSNRLWEESMPDSNIMTAGPMLVWKGRRVPQRDDRTFVTHRHNRTALGLRPDGTMLLLVADGRFAHQAEGLSLPELEHVMLWLGCTEAINLDGGGSSTMYVRDLGGVVNYPSDNNSHDHEGQRPVSNAVIVL